MDFRLPRTLFHRRFRPRTLLSFENPLPESVDGRCFPATIHLGERPVSFIMKALVKAAPFTQQAFSIFCSTNWTVPHKPLPPPVKTSAGKQFLNAISYSAPLKPCSLSKLHFYAQPFSASPSFSPSIFSNRINAGVNLSRISRSISSISSSS